MKVVYFPVKGRVQPIRYLLEDNRIAYEFEEVPIAEWSNYKDKTPFGQLPFIQDGDKTIAQTGAILRYLARKYNLYGDDDHDRVRIDTVHEAAGDIFYYWGQMLYSGEKYEDEKRKFMDNLPGRLKKIQDFISMGLHYDDEERYFLGNKVTYADYTMFDILHNMQQFSPGCVDDFPLLKRCYTAMYERPNIKEFMNKPENKEKKVTISGKI